MTGRTRLEPLLPFAREDGVIKKVDFQEAKEFRQAKVRQLELKLKEEGKLDDIEISILTAWRKHYGKSERIDK